MWHAWEGGAYRILFGSPEGRSTKYGIILKWIWKKLDGKARDWIRLVQGRDKWRAAVSTVSDVRILQHTVNLLPEGFSGSTFFRGGSYRFFNDAVGDSNGGIVIIKMKRNRSLNTSNCLLAKMESSYVITCFGLLLWPSSGYNLVALRFCTICLKVGWCENYNLA
jgi:hypothetical protein